MQSATLMSPFISRHRLMARLTLTIGSAHYCFPLYPLGSAHYCFPLYPLTAGKVPLLLPLTAGKVLLLLPLFIPPISPYRSQQRNGGHRVKQHVSDPGGTLTWSEWWSFRLASLAARWAYFRRAVSRRVASCRFASASGRKTKHVSCAFQMLVRRWSDLRICTCTSPPVTR